jgi:hypothetical protein
LLGDIYHVVVRIPVDKLVVGINACERWRLVHNYHECLAFLGTSREMSGYSTTDRSDGDLPAMVPECKPDIKFSIRFNAR